MNTASETISFAKSLDTQAASFYKELASKFGTPCEGFTAFAAENKKYTEQIERAYYGVITDAIEGCFSFDLDPDAYRVNMDIAKIERLEGAMLAAIELEDAAARFYRAAADQGKLTMADVGRALALVARKREDRVRKMRSPV